jgi:pimeloyl-ACP methyl ester carboxylesterase
MSILAKKYHVYLLEHRGHGKSESPEHGYHVGRFAKDVREFLEHLGVESAHWMGHSMGCAILWCYIELFGQGSINKLILVDQAPFLLADPNASVAEARQSGGIQKDPWRLVGAFASSWQKGWSVFKRYYPVLKKSPKPSPWALKYRQIPQPVPDNRKMAKLLFNHLSHDWRDIIQMIDVPTLYITGEDSFATTPECRQWFTQAIKDVRYVEFSSEEYGSHYMMMENPQRFSQVVLSFLEE